jgi:methylmalonyl-CoA mutase
MADWLELARQSLKGADVASLDTPGPDGLTIRPIYPRVDAATPVPPRHWDAERAWDIRARVAHGGPSAVNAAIRAELAAGAASVLIAIDPAGAAGVAIGSDEAFAEAIRDVLIDVAPVALDAGFLGVQAGAWLAAAAKGSPAAPLELHFDPLSAFAAAGSSPGPIEAHVAAAGELAARLAPVHPRAGLFLASGLVAHEAGAGPAGELAFACAAAVAYAKAMAQAGVTVPGAFAPIRLGLAVDADTLISVAKLRAARRLWARICEVCGAASPASIEARSSRRMLTRADPWTNMVRLTAAGFAAAVGGADALVLGAFTDALGPPTPFARRTARNTQLILMEEAHLGSVADPVAGAGAFEALTEEIARAAWARFTAIEAAGGLIAALKDGMIAREVARGREDLAASLADGRARIVGVTDYRPGDARPAAIDDSAVEPASGPDPRLAGLDSVCPALAPITLEDLAG